MSSTSPYAYSPAFADEDQLQVRQEVNEVRPEGRQSGEHLRLMSTWIPLPPRGFDPVKFVMCPDGHPHEKWPTMLAINVVPDAVTQQVTRLFVRC